MHVIRSRTNFLVLTSFLILSFCGCASAPQRPIVKKEAIYLKDLCARYGILWQWDSVSRVITLNGNNKEARVLVGSDLVVMKDQKIVLSGPIKIVDSLIVVPIDFKDKVIPCFVSEPSQVSPIYNTYKKVQNIVIDPGHGGKDPGAISRKGLQEKVVVLDIAKRLKAILKDHGLSVTMTRETDKFIPLNERVESASMSKADVFLSIHANSSPASKVYGMEIYTLKDLGYLEKNEDQRKLNYNILFKKLSMDNNNFSLEEIVSDMLYTSKQGESRRFAEIIAKNAKKVLDIKNRGIKTSRFFVLRNTLCPAVLVEIGFLTNSKEERLMKTSAYRQKVAKSLSKGILEYCGR